MNKIRFVAIASALALVLMGASECNIGGKSSNESCNITARDTENISMHCKDNNGGERDDTVRAPSDLYPKCQVGTYWPGCKGK